MSNPEVDRIVKWIGEQIEKAYIGQRCDAIAREEVSNIVTNQLSYLGAMPSKIKLNVTGDDGHIDVQPANLYTLVAMMFPGYIDDCASLPETGQTMLENDVVVRYTHESGACIMPPKPAEFITINFEIGEKRDSTERN